MIAQGSEWPSELVGILEEALTQTLSRLRVSLPTLSVGTLAWLASLTGGAPLATYFTRPRAFPLLLLPWWLESLVRQTPSSDFQRDLVYSTINGYYAVRLIDNLMDRDKPPPAEVIPALEFFHTEFTLPYTRYFGADHAFWRAFRKAWFGGAEAASLDATFDVIDEARFIDVSARKTVGAQVPLVAVCHHYQQLDLLEPWRKFVELFGVWHQMQNDIVGWYGDLAAGRTTYFLSRAQSAKRDGLSVAEWVVTDGLAWGVSQLDTWMGKLLSAAQQLDCPPLTRYLEERQRVLEREWERLQPDLAALSRLAASLR